MERFADQPLGDRPHLAVFSSTKVGNFVVTTPLLRGLKEKYPRATLDFFGSDVTRDFEEHCPHIDFRFSLYSDRDDFLAALTRAVAARVQAAGPYDLAVNCDGFAELNLVAVTAIAPRYIAGGALAPGFRDRLPAGTAPEHRMLLDDDWDSPEFLERYRGTLSSNYIAEIFCRMAFVETDFYRLELPTLAPGFDVPDVLVHATTTRTAKMWPTEHWVEVLRCCAERGLSTGLVGSAPTAQRTLYNAGDLEAQIIANTDIVDLRGQTSLIRLAGALERARALVTVDAGPLHVAAAVGCPTIALFGNDADGVGASPARLWAPRAPHVHVTRTAHTCTVCRDNRYRNPDCLVAGHPCMTELEPAAVLDALDALLAGSEARSVSA